MIQKYPSKEILNHVHEISLDSTQARKMLAGNERNVIPTAWDIVKDYDVSSQYALLLISIIFSHKTLIELFKNSINSEMQGVIRRTNIEEKTYTNLAYALNKAGVALDFKTGADKTSYDLSPVFAKNEIGTLVKDIIKGHLENMGWNEPTKEQPFQRSFYEQIKFYDFHKVLGLSFDQFKNWLEGENVVRTLGKEYPLNQILYGPPGSGKTHNAINHALAIIKNQKVEDLISEQNQDKEARKSHKNEFDELVKAGRIQFVTFHQSYSYEEFVEGLKAKINDDDQVYYEIEDGIFKKLCIEAGRKATLKNGLDDAINQFVQDVLDRESDFELETEIQKKKFKISVKDPSTLIFIPNTEKHTEMKLKIKHIKNFILSGDTSFYPSYVKSVGEYIKKTYASEPSKIDNTVQPYVLIIDEINRGNISKIFGELITLIEDSKRLGKSESLKVRLTYSGSDSVAPSFGVPDNLYIVGTMNTADKSISLVDLALRRRFTFIEYAAEPSYLGTTIEGIELDKLLGKMNERIEFLLDKDHQLGHSYFLHITNKNQLCELFLNKIIPLLQEYFYNDFKKICWVLGSNDQWNKEKSLKLIQRKLSFNLTATFGFNLDDEYDGKAEEMYEVDVRLRNHNYDELPDDVFIRIYNRNYQKPMAIESESITTEDEMEVNSDSDLTADEK